MSRKGRELERIVHALERCWSPAEAELRSPDFIEDRVTGGRREVDVSIRYKLGSVPVLVIVECRDRNDVEDVTWIEQVAKKRDDLKAARAVVVSSCSFSANAVAKAQHEAIEIRTVEDLTPERIGHWRMPTVLPGSIVKTEIQHVSFVVSGPPIDDDMRKKLSIPDLHSNVFYSPAFNEWRSLLAIWQQALHDNPQILTGAPDDGSVVGREVHLNYDDADRYALRVGDGFVPLNSIIIEAAVWKELRVSPRSKLYAYDSPEGLHVENAEYKVALDESVLKLTFHRDAAKGQMGITIRHEDAAGAADDDSTPSEEPTETK